MTQFTVNASNSLLLVVDIQERLLPAIDGQAADSLLKATELLARAAEIFGVPVLVSEQYPRGLGPTVGPLATALNTTPLAKTEFSCWANSPIQERIRALERKCIVVCGIEAHICVLQSAVDLVNAGYQVFVAADGVGSRDPSDRDVALRLLEKSGAWITSSETVAFQWAQKAGTPEFKALSNRLR